MSGAWKGAYGDWGCNWVTDAPLVELSHSDLLNAVAELRASLGGFVSTKPAASDNKLPAHETKEIGGGGASAPLTVDAAWVDRWGDTVEVLDMIKADPGRFFNRVYRLFGRPAGILCYLKAEDSVFIPYLVTHSAVYGAGAVMIECAATISQAWGYDGRVKLKSLNKRSDEAYLAMGFRFDEPDDADDPEGGGAMTLVPAAPRWSLRGGKWLLVSTTKSGKYLSTLAVPKVPPPPSPPPPD